MGGWASVAAPPGTPTVSRSSCMPRDTEAKYSDHRPLELSIPLKAPIDPEADDMDAQSNSDDSVAPPTKPVNWRVEDNATYQGNIASDLGLEPETGSGADSAEGLSDERGFAWGKWRQRGPWQEVW